jgi:CheY-like chemotaxis protein
LGCRLRSGLQWTRGCPGHKLRTRSLTLPIEAITAHAMKGDREISIEAWMNGYISKPYQQPAKAIAIALAGTGFRNHACDTWELLTTVQGSFDMNGGTQRVASQSRENL